MSESAKSVISGGNSAVSFKRGTLPLFSFLSSTHSPQPARPQTALSQLFPPPSSFCHLLSVIVTMDWLADKTGSLLNTSAVILDNVVQSGSRFEATLSPAAIRVVKASMSRLSLSRCSHFKPCSDMLTSSSFLRTHHSHGE